MESRSPSDQFDTNDWPLLVLAPVRSSSGTAPVFISQPRLTIGSAEDCDVRLTVTGVEKRHCLLLLTGNQQLLLKAFSPKTWVNDGAAREAQLSVGDQLTIGPVEFRLEARSSARPCDRSVVQSGSHVDEHDELAGSEIDPLFGPCRPSTLAGSQPSALASMSIAQPRVSPTTPANDEGRRQALVAESIQDLQQLVDKFLDRHSEADAALKQERAEITLARKELERQRQEIADQSVELNAGIAELKAAEEGSRGRFDLSQLEECRGQVEQELLARCDRVKAEQKRVDEYEDELARRSSTLARQARNLRIRQKSIAAETKTLHARELEVTERQSVLKRQGEALARQTHQLAEREADVARREKEVESLQSELAGVREELAERNRALSAQQQEHETQVQEFNRRRQNLDFLAGELDNRERALEVSLSELNQQRDSLGLEQQELSRRFSELQARELAVVEHTESLEQLQSALEQQRDDLARQKEQIEAQRRELEQSRRAAAEGPEETAAAAEREQHLAEREQALAEREQSIEAARLELRERELAHDVRESSLLENAERLAARERTVADRQNELSDQHEHLEQRERRLQQEQQRLESQRQQLDAQQSHLDVQRQRLEEEQRRLEEDRLQLEGAMQELVDERHQLDVLRGELELGQRTLDERVRTIESLEESLGAREQDMLRREHVLEQCARAFDGRQPDFGPPKGPPVETRSPPSHDDSFGTDESGGAALLAAPSVDGENTRAPDREVHADAESIPDLRPVAIDDERNHYDSDDAEDAVGKLRLQLAELFGLKLPDADFSFPASTRPPSLRERRQSNDLAESRQSGAEGPVWVEDTESDGSEPIALSPVHDTKSSADVDDETEDAVSAYISNLLRPTLRDESSSVNRPAHWGGLSNEGSSSSLAIADLIELDDEWGHQREATRAEEDEATVDAREKMVVADLSSFRELANFSARSAVARSNAFRKRSDLRIYAAIAVVSWLCTVAMFWTESWMGATEHVSGSVACIISVWSTWMSGLLYLQMNRLRNKAKSMVSEPSLLQRTADEETANRD